MTLRKKVKDDIDTIASDSNLQITCLDAMFQECERGTDLWEWLEAEMSSFKEETRLILWGPEEYYEEYEGYSLYNQNNPNQIIDAILSAVAEKLKKKINGI